MTHDDIPEGRPLNPGRNLKKVTRNGVELVKSGLMYQPPPVESEQLAEKFLEENMTAEAVAEARAHMEQQGDTNEARRAKVLLHVARR